MQRIVVIGAGIVGAALAWELAGAGAQVTVLEAGLPAGAASGRSFGWINASFYLSNAHFALRHAAMAAHRQLAQDLPGLHLFQGCLWWEEAGDGMDRAQAALTAQGYAVARLTRAQVAEREPALVLPPPEALHFPDEGAVEATRLVPRLLSRPGIRLVAGMQASLAMGDGRVLGVDTNLGRLVADHVVLAAGTGTPGLLAPLGLTLPMLDRPGLLLRTAPVGLRLNHILAAGEQEIRQDADGCLIAPAVAGHQAHSGAGLLAPEVMVRDTLDRIERLLALPGLQAESLAFAQRPVPGDGLPAVGAVPGVRGLSMAVAHSGITLAPLIGALLTREILHGQDSPLLAPFRPARLM